MPKQRVTSGIFLSVLVSLVLFTGGLVYAQDKDAASIDIVEFQKILDSIENAKLPDDIKGQLFRDMQTSLIETVRQSDIPENKKANLIRDLKSVTP